MNLLEKINNNRVYIIAEMSANHGGKLDHALEIVRAAKEAGADCLKIQTYTASTMTIKCDQEHFKIKGGLWDGQYLYDLYQVAHTPWEWHLPIMEECEKSGLDFLSTPFDRTSVDFLEELGVEFYKIASFELVDLPLIEYVAEKGKPMILSCGMASVEEIQDAVAVVRQRGVQEVVLLKCCSEYPAKYENMNLSVIPAMSREFALPVGLSDHSMGSLAAVVAVSLGAKVVEKHFCLSRSIKNPDSDFSMEPAEFKAMVEDIKSAIDVLGSPSYELSVSERSSLVFRRSIFAVKNIEAGERFTEENIKIIRPGYGAKPKHYPNLLEQRAGRNYSVGDPIL